MKKVIGLGNALVDIMTSLQHDDFLNDLGFQKGSMQLVDRHMSDKVLALAANLKQELASGGSAANTIHGLARLGIETAYIGKTGSDSYGDFFRDDMIRSGIQPVLLNGSQETGRAVALISPDSERTFATFLGAAVELTASDLKPEMFRSYNIFHIEGYLVQNYELIETAVNLARREGLEVSLDMASFNVVEQHIDFLKRIVAEGVDIIFANEEEAKAFTGEAPETAVEILARISRTAIVKTGVGGSLVRDANGLHRVDAFRADVRDTTGAGDIYASGFLYGYIRGLKPVSSGRIGSLLAARVIEHIGAKIPDALWTTLLKQVAEIEAAN